MMLLFHKKSSEGHGQRRPCFLRFSGIAVFVLVAVLLIFLPGCARERAGEDVQQKPRPQPPSQLSEDRPEAASVQKAFTRPLVALAGEILPFRIPTHGVITGLQYSPNGRYLAYIQDGDIWLYDQQMKLLYGEPVIWHPSGDYLLLRFEPTPTVPPFESRIVDRYGREIVTVPGFVRAVWSPDGKQFAYIDDYDSHKVHIAAFPPPGGKKTVVKTIYYDDTVELIAW